jgi:hypothetical protein
MSTLKVESKRLSLTQGKVALVDAKDFEHLMQWNWYAHYHKGHDRWEARRNSSRLDGERRVIRMHRYLLGEPEGVEIDHKNGNALDNRRVNLRVCTTSQNQMNRGTQKNNSSGFKGVSFNRNAGKYTATIRKQGKLYYLGLFEDPEEAARAYDRKARELHGEFAKLNFA